MENEFGKKSNFMGKECWDDPQMEKRKQRGRLMGGLILVAGGGLWLAHAMGVALPAWLFTWPAFIIFIGIYLLGKNGLQRPGGLIMLVIGGVFMFEQANPGIQIRHYFWPVFIILAGLFMILNPWRKKKRERWENWKNNMHLGDDTSTGDHLDVNAIFGGVEKNIISKQFKGGQVNCVFGGADINLSQADFQGTIVMEVNTVFGGIELAVPSNWTIKSEITAVLGGVSDNRPTAGDTGDASKVLVIKGNAVFGGIEIKSYI